MAPPKRPWFRFYVEALWDRKLRKLSPAHRWLWVTILGCARSSPVPGVLLLVEGGAVMDIDDIADAAALKASDVRRGLKAIEDLGMIEHDPDQGGAYRVVKWNERQYESDRRPKAAGNRRRNDGDTPPNERRNGAEHDDDGAPPENRRQKTETDTPLTPASGGAPKTNPRANGTNPRAVEERRKREQAAARQAVIDACERCDENGKRWVEDEDGFTSAEICEHEARVVR